MLRNDAKTESRIRKNYKRNEKCEVLISSSSSRRNQFSGEADEYANMRKNISQFPKQFFPDRSLPTQVDSRFDKIIARNVSRESVNVLMRSEQQNSYRFIVFQCSLGWSLTYKPSRHSLRSLLDFLYFCHSYVGFEVARLYNYYIFCGSVRAKFLEKADTEVSKKVQTIRYKAITAVIDASPVQVNLIA